MLDNDHQLSRRSLAWTHGFGRPDRPSDVTEVDFIIDLACGAPLAEVSFGKTKEAEDNAGWPPSVYWYVGTLDPAFGDSAMGEWNPALSIDAQIEDGSACPFDSGAIAVDECKIPVTSSPPLEYLQQHLVNLGTWHGAIVALLSASYDRFEHYVDREAPTPPMTNEDHSLLTHDARAWTWEARVCKREVPNVIERPDHIFWRSEERRRIVEARLEDRYTAEPEENLLLAQEVIAARSTVSGSGDHRTDLRAALIERERG